VLSCLPPLPHECCAFQTCIVHFRKTSAGSMCHAQANLLLKQCFTSGRFHRRVEVCQSPVAQVVPLFMQDSVAQSAGLPAMVQMLTLPDDERRCSAMWALANLIHAASPAVCDAVMAALPWNQFVPLLQDTSSYVQVSSLPQAWRKEATMYQTNASQAMCASGNSFASRCSRFDVVSFWALLRV